MENAQILTLIETTAKQARVASLELATLSTDKKNTFLRQLAEQIIVQKEAIIEANAMDLEAAKTNGLSGPMVERLTLTEKRIGRK